jgi:hypothetical protein
MFGNEGSEQAYNAISNKPRIRRKGMSMDRWVKASDTRRHIVRGKTKREARSAFALCRQSSRKAKRLMK